MSSRWTGFFIWALVAASTAFWGIKIFAATRPVPAGAQAPQAIAANGPMERLFGAVVVAAVAAPAQHPESERFQLVGLIATPEGTESPGGVAIVSVDGQPAKPFHVGATLDGNTTLLVVAKRTADFGPSGGPSSFSLQLPEPAAAETGTLAPPVTLSGAQSPTPGLPPAVQAQMAAQRGGVAPQGTVGGRGGMPPQAVPSQRGGFANINGVAGRTTVPGQPNPGVYMRQAPGAAAQPRTAPPDPAQNDGSLQQ
jgi:general secretion pathway protein C